MTSRFLDTNVLLYAVSPDPQEAAKRAVARQDWALSTQVLQESYVNAVAAKGNRPALMTPEAAHEQRRFWRWSDSYLHWKRLPARVRRCGKTARFDLYTCLITAHNCS